MAGDNYKLQVDIEAIGQSLDQAISKLERLLAIRNEIQKEIKATNPDDAARIAELEQKYAELKATIAGSKKEVDELARANERLAKAHTLEAKQTAVVNEQIKYINKQYREQAQQVLNLGGAYEQLNREFQSNYKKAQDLLASTQQLTKADYEFIKSVNEMDARLKAIDKTLGNSRRFVGEYERGNIGLKNSIAQVTREFPAFTHSVQTGFLALSNNLPILADEIGKLREQNRLLMEQGKPTQSVLGAIASSFFSWQTAMSIGITLLVVYSKEIWAFTQRLFAMRKEIDAVTVANDALNRAKKDGIEQSRHERVEMEALFKQARNQALTLVEREKAVKQLKETYPEYLKNISDETLLSGQAGKVMKEVNQLILDREENLRKLAEIEVIQKQYEDLISTNQELKKSQAGLAEYRKELDRVNVTGDRQLAIIEEKARIDKELEKVIENEKEIAKLYAAKQRILATLGDITKDNDEKGKERQAKLNDEIREFNVRIGESVAQLRETRTILRDLNGKETVLKIKIETVDTDTPVDEKAVISAFDKMNEALLSTAERRRQLQNKAQQEESEKVLMAQQQKIEAEKRYFVKSLDNNKDYFDKKETELNRAQAFELQTLEKTIKNENEFNDARIELEKRYANEREKLRIQEEEQKKRIIFEERKRVVEQADFIINTTAAAIEQQAQRRQEGLDRQADDQQKSESLQRARAEQGLQNTLEFEQRRAAELQLEKERQAKQERNRAKVLSYYNLLSGYAKSEPDSSQALYKAARDIALSEAITAAFAEKGGVIGEGTEQTTLTGGKPSKRHKSGNDVLLLAEKGEGVLTTTEVAALGGVEGFDQFRKTLKNPQALSRPIAVLAPKYESDNTLISEVRELKQIMKEKPVHQTALDSFGNVINTRIEGSVRTVTKVLTEKPLFAK